MAEIPGSPLVLLSSEDLPRCQRPVHRVAGSQECETIRHPPRRGKAIRKAGGPGELTDAKHASPSGYFPGEDIERRLKPPLCCPTRTRRENRPRCLRLRQGSREWIPALLRTWPQRRLRRAGCCDGGQVATLVCLPRTGPDLCPGVQISTCSNLLILRCFCGGGS